MSQYSFTRKWEHTIKRTYLWQCESYGGYDLLVINDFGLMELDVDKCHDLFEIIETRDSKKPTMIVSQLPVAK